jgi:exopolysaccharide production protein ExoQ
MAMPHAVLGRWVPDQRYALIVTTLVSTLIVLMIVPEGFNYQMVVAGQTPTSGGLVSRLLWLGLLAGATAVVLWRAALAWMLLRALNPWLLWFTLLALASVLWSIDPMLSVRRDIRLVTILMVALAFALVSWHPWRLQSLLRNLLSWMLMGSILFALAAPQLAIHQETSAELVGAWRGLSNHKNTFGALACIAALLWLHAGLARETPWTRALAGWTLAAVCLLLSRSATSLIAASLGTVLLLILMCSPRELQPFAGLTVGLIALFMMLYALALLEMIPGLRVLLAPVTALTDMDTSFTGRRYIWNIISEHVSQSPVCGTGYGAYWAGPTPDSPSYEFVVRMGSFYPGSAHNGYLEIINDLGWVGLACLVCYLLTYLAQSLRVYGADRRQGALYLVLFIQQAMANLSESHWLNVLSVSFVFMTLATAGLGRLLLELKLRARFGAPRVQLSARALRRAMLRRMPARSLHPAVLAPRA